MKGAAVGGLPLAGTVFMGCVLSSLAAPTQTPVGDGIEEEAARPKVPRESSDCLEPDRAEEQDWFFIEEEYRQSGYMFENSDECLHYVNDPLAYMRVLNDRTPFIPTRIEQCKLRRYLRRMDTQAMVGKTGNMILKRRYCEHYFENRDLYSKEHRIIDFETERKEKDRFIARVSIIIAICFIVGGLLIVAVVLWSKKVRSGERSDSPSSAEGHELRQSSSFEERMRRAEERISREASPRSAPPPPPSQRSGRRQSSAGRRARALFSRLPSYNSSGAAPPTYEEATNIT